MAQNVLTIGGAKKSAGDRVRMSMDFGNQPLLIDGYTIVSYSVTTTGSGAPTVSSTQLDYSYQLSALITGGTAGNQYDLTFSITLNDPDATIISRTGVVSILP